VDGGQERISHHLWSAGEVLDNDNKFTWGHVAKGNFSPLIHFVSLPAIRYNGQDEGVLEKWLLGVRNLLKAIKGALNRNTSIAVLIQGDVSI
jgi:hypothetical protein